MRLFISCFLAITLTLGAGCRPRGGAPGDEPARAGNAVAAEGADPLMVVRAYAESWRDGDARAFLSLVHSRTAEQRKSAEAFAEVIAQTAKLHAAAARKFGPEAADRILAVSPFPPTNATGRQMLEHLDSPDWDDDVEITGDRAVVGVEPVGVVELQRVGGRWKVLLVDPEIGAEDEAENLSMFRRLAELHRQFAQDVNRGKYASADDARRAYRNFVAPEPELR